MTDEQKAKAEAALKDYRSQKLRKRILLRIYRGHQEQARRWCLPFRMVHRQEFIAGQIRPNDFYPLVSDVGRAADGSPYHIEKARRITEADAIFYFTQILAANEAAILEYKPSDWTGEAISKEEAERQRQMYIDRIRDFQQNPQKYDTERHPLPPDLKERYFVFDGDI